jgi:hypothetical protein
MAGLKRWYKVVIPREDLREGKPLDAAEFAVNPDPFREGRAPEGYKNPERFFWQDLFYPGPEELRRPSRDKTETSAVFHLITQLRAGNTHGLTYLYHLPKNGPAEEKPS